MLTTYSVCVSNADDRAFIRKIKFQTVIFDEGHMLKNMKSQRYTNLMKVRCIAPSFEAHYAASCCCCCLLENKGGVVVVGSCTEREREREREGGTMGDKPYWHTYELQVRGKRRILLTGTPLQNNLLELISLLGFIMPQIFANNLEVIVRMFKKYGASTLP